MNEKKIILVGLPGSGIETVFTYIKNIKPIKYFSCGKNTDLEDNFLYKFIDFIDHSDISSIYDNNYFVTMYNSIQYNGNVYVEGINIGDWDDGDILVTTPYEFINLPNHILKDSIIIWVDNTKNYIKNSDGIEKLNIFNKVRGESTSLFYDLIKDLPYVYLLNEDIERVAGVCEIILQGNDNINNILLKTFNK